MDVTVAACIDLTSASSIAGKTLDTLSVENKEAFNSKIHKNLKKSIDKNMKDVVLGVAHSKALEDMNIKHLTLSVVPTSQMIHKLKPTMKQLFDTEGQIKVGGCVKVLYEYAPGACSDGGVGTVVKIETDDDGKSWLTVSYVLDNRIETGIDESRITITMMPYKDITSASRDRRNAASQLDPVELMPDRQRNVPELTPLEWLEYGLKSRTHEKKGWLKDKLLEYDLMEANDEGLWKRVISDYKCQLSAIEGMR